MLSTLKSRIGKISGKTLNTLVTADNIDFILNYLHTQFGDGLVLMSPRSACLDSYLSFATSMNKNTNGPLLLVYRTRKLENQLIDQNDFYFFNRPWWDPSEIRCHPDGRLVWTDSVGAPTEFTYVGDPNHIRYILGQTLDTKSDGITSTADFPLLYTKLSEDTQ